MDIKRLYLFSTDEDLKLFQFKLKLYQIFSTKNIDPSFFCKRSKLNKNKTIAKSEISERKKKRSLNTDTPFAKKNK